MLCKQKGLPRGREGGVWHTGSRKIDLLFSGKCITSAGVRQITQGSAVCAPGHTGKSSNQTLPHSLAVSLAASTQTVTVNCSSCLVTSPEIILMWQEACPCSLCMPCTGEGEAAAGREHLGILMVLPANAAD